MVVEGIGEVYRGATIVATVRYILQESTDAVTAAASGEAQGLTAQNDVWGSISVVREGGLEFAQTYTLRLDGAHQLDFRIESALSDDPETYRIRGLGGIRPR